MFMNAKQMNQEKKSKNIFSKLFGFLGSVKSEFKQLSWTSRKELVKLTRIVLFATFTIGLTVYLVDLAIQKSLSLVHYLTQLIFG